jgi:hypothetical protein
MLPALAPLEPPAWETSAMQLKSIARRAKRLLLGDVERSASAQLLLSGRVASLAVRRLAKISSISDVGFGVYSGEGEDGIIDWLVERLDIDAHSFVEFGVEDYRESNTRFLLRNRNWRGLVLDGSARNVEYIANDSLSWRHDLSARAAFITRENINDLLKEAGFCGEIGLLSIDIDGNDYWVWEQIEAVDPIICICEYNAIFGDLGPITIPYEADFFRTRAHHSNLYFGASVAALRFLASKKGYRFVGTNLGGGNAFFVRNDYAARLDGAIQDVSARPNLCRESRDEGGHLTYVSGLRRLALIAHLPVVNVKSGETIELRSVNPIYSDVWLKEMGAGSPVVKRAPALREPTVLARP